MYILYVFITITILFIAVLLIKNLFFSGKDMYARICALCIAVTLTWFSLLLLRWLNYFPDTLIIGILMGSSSLALYYLSQKIESLKKFGLPILLTLYYLTYVLISLNIDILVVFLLIILWFTIVFIDKMKNKNAREIIKKLIECCKNF